MIVDINNIGKRIDKYLCDNTEYTRSKIQKMIETGNILVNGNKVKAVNYVYGIGGRDTTEKEIESVYTDLQEIAKTEKVENPYRYLGLRKE